jgi:Protein kinase domain/HYR domain
MAVVHLARQLELGRSVALKELASFGVGDPALADRFVRESRLAGSLSHPNVVHVYDFFEFEGTPYIAMEYLERGSLRPLVRGLSVPQVAGVCEGLLAGLSHAAARGVVHRDLKPENVLITDEGAVKIADFGIAKAVEEVGDERVRTVTGATVGTPAYMAPEQAMAGEIGPWTDLYSLGVMAYEMLAGRLPFDASGSPMALLMRHVNDPVPPLREVAPDVDPRLADWVHRLLAKAPAERPAGPAAAWDELEEIVLDTCGPRWRREARLFEEAGRSASGLAESAGPRIVRLGGAELAPAVHETSAPTRGKKGSDPFFRTPPTAAAAPSMPTAVTEPARPRRRRMWPLVLAGALALAAAGVIVAVVVSSGDNGGAPAATTGVRVRAPVAFRPALVSAMTQLVRDNRSMSSRLQGLHPGSGSVSALARADLARAQITATRDLLASLHPRTAQDRRLEDSASRVIAAERRFLDAVIRTLRRDAKPSTLAALGGLSAHLVARLSAFDGLVPGAMDSIQGTHKLKVWASGPPPSTGTTGTGSNGASTPPPQSNGSGSNSGGSASPLVLHLPGGASATSSTGGPVPVSFTASASEGSQSVTVSCSPGSGSAFPVGTTTVSCTASDGRGQTKTGSFTVTVTAAPATTPETTPTAP